MSATRKKVIIRQFGGDLYRGYLPASGLGAEDLFELLLPDGRVQSCLLRDVKYVAFVREFRLDDQKDPEQIGPRAFSSRPRGVGVWVQVGFTDDDQIQGLMHGGLAFFDSLLLDRGVFLDPPDKRGNTQRLFIPRSSLTAFEILGIAGAPSRAQRLSIPEKEQPSLFEGTSES